MSMILQKKNKEIFLEIFKKWNNEKVNGFKGKFDENFRERRENTDTGIREENIK